MPEYGAHRCDPCDGCRTCLVCGPQLCPGFPDGEHRLLRGEYEDRLEPPLSGAESDPAGASRHAALVAVSPGYRAFAAEMLEDDSEDIDMLWGFARWHLHGEAAEYSDWSADQWRDRWDFWNS